MSDKLQFVVEFGKLRVVGYQTDPFRALLRLQQEVTNVEDFDDSRRRDLPVCQLRESITSPCPTNDAYPDE